MSKYLVEVKVIYKIPAKNAKEARNIALTNLLADCIKLDNQKTNAPFPFYLTIHNTTKQK